jgi:hypothetical protein
MDGFSGGMTGRRAAQFLAFLDALPSLTIQPFDAKELGKARLMLGKFADWNLTLADAHGLVVMTDHRSSICWSTDRRLRLTGVELPI